MGGWPSTHAREPHQSLPLSLYLPHPARTRLSPPPPPHLLQAPLHIPRQARTPTVPLFRGRVERVLVWVIIVMEEEAEGSSAERPMDPNDHGLARHGGSRERRHPRLPAWQTTSSSSRKRRSAYSRRRRPTYSR
jgi:hypothetical protein